MTKMRLWIFEAILAIAAFIYVQAEEEFFYVSVKVDYKWEVIAFFNNTKAIPYSEIWIIFKSAKTNYFELETAVMEAAFKAGWKVGFGRPLFEVVSVDIDSSMDPEISQKYKETIERKEETTTFESVSRQFRVGANSYGALHQLAFYGPGVDFKTGTVYSEILPAKRVHVKCKAKRILMLTHITFHDDVPSNNLIDVNDHSSPNINARIRGSRIYLQSEWTHDKYDAMTGLKISIQDSECNGLDFTTEADIKNHCIDFLYDENAKSRVYEVGLLKSPRNDRVYNRRREFGWEECSSDMNAARGGSWLHLCWNNVRFPN